METKLYGYFGLWLATLGVAFTSQRLCGATFNVATAQDFQNALTTAAHNGQDNTIFLTNSYYQGNFDFNSSLGQNLSIHGAPGTANTQITLDAGSYGSSLNVENTGSGAINISGITLLRNCGATTNAALSVAGGASAPITITDCQVLCPSGDQGLGIEVASGFSLVISNTTISGDTNGLAIGAFDQINGQGPGVSISGITGDVQILGCDISQNSCSPYNCGAGLNISGAASVEVINSTVTDNYGGGANCSAANVTYASNLFAGNVVALWASCDSFGQLLICPIGYAAGAQATGAEITFLANSFVSNSVIGEIGGDVLGVGAYAMGSSVVFANNLFNGNYSAGADVTGVATYNNAADGAGACAEVSYDAVNGSFAFTANTFTNNSGTGHGGGLCIIAYPDSTLSMVLVSNLFLNNSAGDGGGLCFLNQGNAIDASISANVFAKNASSGNGGGAEFFDDPHFPAGQAEVILAGNTFSNDQAGGTGGGASFDLPDSTVSLQANTINDNLSTGDGGGIYLAVNSGAVDNNRFTGNNATNGGALFAIPGTKAEVINNTMTANLAIKDGGGTTFQVAGVVAILDVYNNIIWGNSAKNGADVWLAGTGSDREFSFNDATGLFGIWDSFDNNTNADPKFVDSEDGNYDLQSGSPCIDAGTTNAPSLPTTDLDGNPRIVGRNVDMGCYEFNSAPIYVSLQPSPTNGVVIKWPSVAGVNYAVQKSTNLSNGFSDLISSLPTTAPVNTYTDVPTPGTPAAFYRIRSW